MFFSPVSSKIYYYLRFYNNYIFDLLIFHDASIIRTSQCKGRNIGVADMNL
jgi:hypothetical protein